MKTVEDAAGPEEGRRGAIRDVAARRWRTAFDPDPADPRARRLNLLSFRLVLAVAFAAWLASLALTDLERFPPDALHFARQVHPLYYASVGLTLSWFLWRLAARNAASETTGADLLAVVLLAGLATPGELGVYNNLRYGDVYGVLYDIDYISGSAHLAAPANAQSYIYSYPGLAFWLVTFAKVAGITPAAIAVVFPTLVLGFLMLSAWVVGRRISRRRAPLAPLAVATLSWIQEYHLSPQSFTLLLYSTLFLVTWLSIADAWKPHVVFTLATIVGVAGILAHPVKIFFSLIAVGALAVAALLLHLGGADDVLRRSRIRVLAALTAGLALGWVTWLNVSGSQVTQQIHVALTHSLFLKGQILDALRTIFLPAGTGGMKPNPDPTTLLVNRLRLALLVTFLVLVLGYLVTGIRRKAAYWMGAAVTVSALTWGLASLVTEPGLLGRMFVFCAAPAAALAVATVAHGRFFRRGRRILFTATAVYVGLALLLVPVTRYGGDTFEFRSDSAIAARNFLIDHRIEERRDYTVLAYPGVTDTLSLRYSSVAQFRDTLLKSDVHVRTQSWHNFFATRFSAGHVYEAQFADEPRLRIYDAGETYIQLDAKIVPTYVATAGPAARP